MSLAWRRVGSLNRSAFAEATGATSKALHREGFDVLGRAISRRGQWFAGRARYDRRRHEQRARGNASSRCYQVSEFIERKPLMMHPCMSLRSVRRDP